jgi:ferredoxin-like protein FixX
VSATRCDGTFIAIEVDAAGAADPQTAAKLTEACPVDIFAQDASGALELLARNVDECVLCRLCLDAAPGAVKVLKLYDGSAAL